MAQNFTDYYRGEPVPARDCPLCGNPETLHRPSETVGGVTLPNVWHHATKAHQDHCQLNSFGRFAPVTYGEYAPRVWRFPVARAQYRRDTRKPGNGSRRGEGRG